jgi:hypothetical protein
MFHLSNGRDGENGPAAVAPKAESIPTPAPVSMRAFIPVPAPATATVPPQTPASEPLPTQTSAPVDGFDEFDPRGSFSGNTPQPVFTTI